MHWALDTARGQIIAILVSTLLVTLAVIGILLTLARPAIPPLPPGPWTAALQIKAIAEAMHAASPVDHQRIAAAVSSDALQVLLGSPPACIEAPAGTAVSGMQTILTSLLGGRFGTVTVRQCASATDAGDVAQAELALDGTTLTVQVSRKDGWPQIVILTLPLIVAVLFMLSLVIALSIWTLWRINRPLRMLANTVERFDENMAITPLEVAGSIEIRQVAQAFNRMQERIARSVEERKRMLMAVGHDLRTPLTRLKLRIDIDGAQADHQALRRDLDLMQKMVDGALSYLNDQRDREPAETVDLGTLVEEVCLAFSDAGRDVTYVGVYGWECHCQPVAITRAVGNLIENGCRYGTHVKVDVWCEDQWAIIEVRDNGPGIPAAMRDIVLLPFARLDSARAVEGRLGLGLSIVQEVVCRHGGKLSLTDVDPSGLLVRIALPVDSKGGLADTAQTQAAL